MRVYAFRLLLSHSFAILDQVPGPELTDQRQGMQRQSLQESSHQDQVFRIDYESDV